MTKRRLCAILTVSFGSLALGATRAQAMSVRFSWTGYKACSSSSPAFDVSDVPSSTTHLAFKMVDKNFPSYPHGGGTVAYNGAHRIPAGAFSYKAHVHLQASSTPMNGLFERLTATARR
jgi:hypothetical protein